MAVVWRHYTGVLYECADIRTHVEWSVPVGYLSGDTADTVLLQRRRRQQKPFHKWFFYVFYPLHLLVLGVLRWVVFA